MHYQIQKYFQPTQNNLLEHFTILSHHINYYVPFFKKRQFLFLSWSFTYLLLGFAYLFIKSNIPPLIVFQPLITQKCQLIILFILGLFLKLLPKLIEGLTKILKSLIDKF